MNCNLKKLKSLLVLMLVLAFSISGCASRLTAAGPLVSRLENGKTSVGEVVNYKYSGSVRGNVGFLDKTPMCAKVIEKVRVAKKEPRGFSIILAEIVVFGLGFYDMTRTRAVVEDSKITVPLAKFESSETVLCGEKRPAANEDIVIFVRPAIVGGDKPKSYIRQASTDENGVIDFNKLFPGETRILNLNVWLASDESRAVSFQFKPGL
ncbi:MAG: hypothetical protein C4518_15825 [Desulfobacteraceae bacterium]|nr:MAG: hypothetical protein C4518_15825 [Desulfobacteraceae bacterium]